MRGAWTIAAKDVRQRLRDRSALVAAILTPLLLAVLLGAGSMGGEEDDLVYEYAFVNEDRGSIGDELGEILALLDTEGVLELQVVDRAEAERLVTDDRVAAAIVATEGFSDSVNTGRPAMLEVIDNPEQETGSQVAQAFAATFAHDVGAFSMAVETTLNATGVDPEPATIARLVERARAIAAPASLARVEAEGTGVSYASHVSFGMAVFFLFFTVQFGVLSLIDERAAGTMTRLLAAPIPRSSILTGKALASFVVGFASVVVLAIATSVSPLQASWGAPAAVVVLTVAGVVAAVSLVALVGAFARTSDEANGYSSFVAVALGLLGGAFFPIGLATGFIERLSLLSPHRWIIDGYRELSAGGSLPDVLPTVAVLLLFAAVTGSIGMLRFRTLTRSP